MERKEQGDMMDIESYVAMIRENSREAGLFNAAAEKWYANKKLSDQNKLMHETRGHDCNQVGCR